MFFLAATDDVVQSKQLGSHNDSLEQHVQNHLAPFGDTFGDTFGDGE